MTIELCHIAYRYKTPDFPLLQLSGHPRLSIYQLIIVEDLNFGRKHTEPILARVEPEALLVESFLSDSALSSFLLQGFRGFTKASQVSKEPQFNSFAIATCEKFGS